MDLRSSARRGLGVAVKATAAAADVVRRPAPGVVVLIYHRVGRRTSSNVDLARDALLHDKVDALFDDGISLAFWLNGTASRACCEFRGGPFLEPRFFGDGIGIAVAKTDPQIRALLNSALRRVRENGRLEELVQRYFPFRVY